MNIPIEVVIFFITMFVSVLGWASQRVINRIDKYEDEVRLLMMDHGQRITTLEVEVSIAEHRKVLSPHS